MKFKSLILAALFAFGFFLANAQVVEKGDKVLNLGIGLGTALYSGKPVIQEAFLRSLALLKLFLKMTFLMEKVHLV